MSKGIFTCNIDYDTNVENGPEYYIAIECSNKAFDFVLNNVALALTIPRRRNHSTDVLTPPYLIAQTKRPVSLTEARKLHQGLIVWKASFRDWYNVLAYSATRTYTLKPYDQLWSQTRLPNNNFRKVSGNVMKVVPKPYAPKQWHIWPNEPVGRRKMERVIKLSSSLQGIPVHYELLAKAIKNFNDEYFDLAVTYSAMALERAIYELATTIPRTKGEFLNSLAYIVKQGLLKPQQKHNYANMFMKLQSDGLTLGGLLTFLPALPWNKPVKRMRILTERLLEKVNNPRVDVLHYGRHVKRNVAHQSVTSTMNLVYGSLPP